MSYSVDIEKWYLTVWVLCCECINFLELVILLSVVDPARLALTAGIQKQRLQDLLHCFTPTPLLNVMCWKINEGFCLYLKHIINIYFRQKNNIWQSFENLFTEIARWSCSSRPVCHEQTAFCNLSLYYASLDCCVVLCSANIPRQVVDQGLSLWVGWRTAICALDVPKRLLQL